MRVNLYQVPALFQTALNRRSHKLRLWFKLTARLIHKISRAGQDHLTAEQARAERGLIDAGQNKRHLLHRMRRFRRNSNQMIIQLLPERLRHDKRRDWLHSLFSRSASLIMSCVYPEKPEG